jgi:hypothetical protein
VQRCTQRVQRVVRGAHSNVVDSECDSRSCGQGGHIERVHLSVARPQVSGIESEHSHIQELTDESYVPLPSRRHGSIVARRVRGKCCSGRAS